MENNRLPLYSRLALWICALFAFFYVSIYQLMPALPSVDDYYHIAVTGFIKQYGFLKEFPWTQMSVMKNFYADKDLLLHVMTLPFTYITDNPIWAAKLAVLFLNALFIGAFIWLVRKYLPDFLAGLALITLFLSPIFTIYFIYLRPGTLASIFTLLGIYFLIHRKKYALFTISLLYTLSHLSSFTLIFFACLCEGVRWLKDREVDWNNILYPCVGMALGLLIHPNFPNNLLAIYINGFLAPIYAFTGKNINFALELYAVTTKKALMDNAIVFAIYGAMFWSAFINRARLSFATIVYTLSAQVYFGLSLLSNRFWYPATPMAVLAAASYLKDLNDAEPLLAPRRTLHIIVVWIILAAGCGCYTVQAVKKNLAFKNEFNRHYELAGEWMKNNIPAGETIYHSSWGDSPYLICTNPKNHYLVVLDPIYMYHWSPTIQSLYQDLYNGVQMDAYDKLKNTFHTRYGITQKQAGFYDLIKDDKRFDIMYDDNMLAIFRLKEDTPPPQHPKQATAPKHGNRK